MAHCVDDTLLVCSSFTNDGTTLDKKTLNCFKWNGTDWETFPTPIILDNTAGISNFIQSVKIPDVGIWFTSAKPPNSQGTPGNNSYLLVRYFFHFPLHFVQIIIKFSH